MEFSGVKDDCMSFYKLNSSILLGSKLATEINTDTKLWGKSSDDIRFNWLQDYVEALVSILHDKTNAKVLLSFNDVKIMELFNIIHTFHIFSAASCRRERICIKHLKVLDSCFRLMIMLLTRMSASQSGDIIVFIVEHAALSAKLWRYLADGSIMGNILIDTRRVSESSYLLSKLLKIVNEKFLSESVSQKNMHQTVQSLIPFLLEIISQPKLLREKIFNDDHQRVLSSIRDFLCCGLFSPNMIVELCLSHDNRQVDAKIMKNSRSKSSKDFFDAFFQSLICNITAHESSNQITLIEFLFRSYQYSCEKLSVRQMGKKLPLPCAGDKQSLYSMLKFVFLVLQRLQSMDNTHFPTVATTATKILQWLSSSYGFDDIRKGMFEDLIGSAKLFDAFILKKRSEMQQSILLDDLDLLDTAVEHSILLTHCDKIHFLLSGMFFSESDVNDSVVACINCDVGLNVTQWKMLSKFQDSCRKSLTSIYESACTKNAFKDYSSVVEFVESLINSGTASRDLKYMIIRSLLYLHERYQLFVCVWDSLLCTRSLDNLFDLLKNSWCNGNFVRADLCCLMCSQQSLRYLTESFMSIPTIQLKSIWNVLSSDTKNFIFTNALLSVQLEIDNSKKISSSKWNNNSLLLDEVTTIFSVSIKILSSETASSEEKAKLCESVLMFTGQVVNYLSKSLCNLELQDQKIANYCRQMSSHLYSIISFPMKNSPRQFFPFFVFTKLRCLLSLYVLNMHFDANSLPYEKHEWVNFIDFDLQYIEQISNGCLEFLFLFLSNINSLETLFAVTEFSALQCSLHQILLQGTILFLDQYLGKVSVLNEAHELVTAIRKSFSSSIVTDSLMVRSVLVDALQQYSECELKNSMIANLKMLGEFYSIIYHDFNITILNGVGESFFSNILKYLNLSKEANELMTHNIDCLCILSWNCYSWKEDRVYMHFLEQLLHICFFLRCRVISGEFPATFGDRIDAVVKLALIQGVSHSCAQELLENLFSVSGDQIFASSTLLALFPRIAEISEDNALLLFIWEKLCCSWYDDVRQNMSEKSVGAVFTAANVVKKNINKFFPSSQMGLTSCLHRNLELLLKSLHGNKKSFSVMVEVLQCCATEYLEQYHKTPSSTGNLSTTLQMFLQVFVSFTKASGNASSVAKVVECFEYLLVNNTSLSRLMLERNAFQNFLLSDSEFGEENWPRIQFILMFIQQLQFVAIQYDLVGPRIASIFGWKGKYLKSFISNAGYRFLTGLTLLSYANPPRHSTTSQSHSMIPQAVEKLNVEALILASDVLELTFIEKKLGIVISVCNNLVFKLDCILAASRSCPKILLKKFPVILKLVSKYYCFLMMTTSCNIELTEALRRDLKKSFQLLSRIFRIINAPSLGRYSRSLLIVFLKDKALSKFNAKGRARGENISLGVDMDNIMNHGLYNTLEKMKSIEKEISMKMLDSVEQIILSDVNEEMNRSNKFEGN